MAGFHSLAFAVLAGPDRPDGSASRAEERFGWTEARRRPAEDHGIPERMTQDRTLSAAMAAVQAGDAEAYRRLLHDCLPVIAGMARAQGVRPEAVDDVVQDVLLTIHRARATYDPARPFLQRHRSEIGKRNQRAGSIAEHDIADGLRAVPHVGFTSVHRHARRLCEGLGFLAGIGVATS